MERGTGCPGSAASADHLADRPGQIPARCWSSGRARSRLRRPWRAGERPPCRDGSGLTCSASSRASGSSPTGPISRSARSTTGRRRRDAAAWLPDGWLWSFGAITVPAGVWLWHGQGPHFGLGLVGRGKVNVVAAYLCLATFLTLLCSASRWMGSSGKRCRGHGRE